MGLNEKPPGEEDEAMGMTMTQKILAAHAGLAEVKAGQLIEAELDLVLGNDITSPVAINEMKKMNRQTVFDKDKIALVMDHFIPNKDIKSAENCKCCREFACRHEISNYFDVGDMGIEHALLPEKGLVVAALQMGIRQGCDLTYHRHDRCGRCPVPLHGIYGRGH